jgi:hypothetical protein
MTLGVLNSTSIAINVVVDGQQIATLGPGEDRDAIPASALPALPWHVEAQTQGGRILLTLTVNDGDVKTSTDAQGHDSERGDAARIDLSCGRIDMWSGPPLAGPAPGPGTPGDCD